MNRIGKRIKDNLDGLQADPYFLAKRNALAWYKEIKELVNQLENSLKVEQKILESVSAVEVRSDWYTLGFSDSSGKPREYRLLLSGGPGARISGELSKFGKPISAVLEMNDIGEAREWKPWPWSINETLRSTLDEEKDRVLLQFAQHFVFER